MMPRNWTKDHEILEKCTSVCSLYQAEKYDELHNNGQMTVTCQLIQQKYHASSLADPTLTLRLYLME